VVDGNQTKEVEMKINEVTSTNVDEYDVPDNFEVDPKHKEINDLGRKMEAMAQTMDKDDKDGVLATGFSRLGPVLAEFGAGGMSANNMADVVKKSQLTKEIVVKLMQKAKAAPEPESEFKTKATRTKMRTEPKKSNVSVAKAPWDK
tara:strand:+ start:628 stop:1065 length:438 start_codon:yes stop_codon:yes gene_type:complete